MNSELIIDSQKIRISLGWDEATNGVEMDCDLAVALLNDKGILTDKRDIVYFGNLTNRNKTVRLMKDSLTGEDEGDDESIVINFSEMSQCVEKIVVLFHIYDCFERNQNVSLIKEGFLRVVDIDDDNEVDRINFEFENSTHTGIFISEFYKKENKKWIYNKLLKGIECENFTEMFQNYK